MQLAMPLNVARTRRPGDHTRGGIQHCGPYASKAEFHLAINPYFIGAPAHITSLAPQLPKLSPPSQSPELWNCVREQIIPALNQKLSQMKNPNIFIGNLVDPYLPTEEVNRLTRSILNCLHDVSPTSQIVIQTESPLIVRDLPLLARFKNLTVNIVIPTDSQETLDLFEPGSTPLNRRWEAANQVIKAGIHTRICLSPLLPVSSVSEFAKTILESGVSEICTSPLFRGKSSLRSPQREKTLAIAKQAEWGGIEYIETVLQLRALIPNLDTKGTAFRPR